MMFYDYDVTIAACIFTIIFINNLVYVFRIAKQDSLKLGKVESNKIDLLRKEIQQLKIEANKYNSTDHFVEYSKIQRKIIQKQKELDKLLLAPDNNNDNLNTSTFSWLPPMLLKYLVTIFLVVIFYSTPVLVIQKVEEKGFVYFLIWPFSLPSWPIGTVGAIPYITIVNQIVHLAIKPFRSLMVKLRTKEKTK